MNSAMAELAKVPPRSSPGCQHVRHRVPFAVPEEAQAAGIDGRLRANTDEKRVDAPDQQRRSGALFIEMSQEIAKLATHCKFPMQF
jgi:hypothetical protein